MTDYQLIIQKGPEPGKIFPLTSASVTIGRDPMVEITIDDAEVSRQHTRLTRSYSGYQVHDLGSTNGTYLDGVRLGGEAVTLQPGQILTLGSGVSIIYQVVSSPKEAYESAVLATMLDAPTPSPEDVLAGVAEDEEVEEVVGIEWSEAVIEAEDVVDEISPEPEMPGFSEHGTEILLATPDPNPPDEAAANEFESAQADWEAEDNLLSDPEPVDVEPFDWDATPDSATILDVNAFEPETDTSAALSASVDPTPDPIPLAADNPVQPYATIDQPDKPKPNNRRIITILLIILILLCCCACGVFYFMYAIGGDLIIDAIMGAGAIP